VSASFLARPRARRRWSRACHSGRSGWPPARPGRRPAVGRGSGGRRGPGARPRRPSARRRSAGSPPPRRVRRSRGRSCGSTARAAGNARRELPAERTRRAALEPVDDVPGGLGGRGGRDDQVHVVGHHLRRRRGDPQVGRRLVQQREQGRRHPARRDGPAVLGAEDDVVPRGRGAAGALAVPLLGHPLQDSRAVALRHRSTRTESGGGRFPGRPKTAAPAPQV
jgi:hypothetical protein